LKIETQEIGDVPL